MSTKKAKDVPTSSNGTKSVAEDETAKKVDEHNKKAQDDANKIIKTKFPQKILELSNIIGSEEFKNFDLSRAAVDMTDKIPIPAAPVDMKDQCKNNKNECSEHSPFLFPKGTIEVNKSNADLIARLKPLLLDLIQDTVILNLGVNLLVPMVEDGNNLGVQIQEAAIELITDVQSKSRIRFDEFLNYYEVRGKFLKVVIRHPHCMDYRTALTQFDENWRFKLIMMFVSMRKDYSLIHDFFVKNLAKINKPRGSSNIENMY